MLINPVTLDSAARKMETDNYKITVEDGGNLEILVIFNKVDLLGDN